MAVLDGSDGNKDGAIDDALKNDDVGSGKRIISALKVMFWISMAIAGNIEQTNSN